MDRREGRRCVRRSQRGSGLLTSVPQTLGVSSVVSTELARGGDPQVRESPPTLGRDPSDDPWWSVTGVLGRRKVFVDARLTRLPTVTPSSSLPRVYTVGLQGPPDESKGSSLVSCTFPVTQRQIGGTDIVPMSIQTRRDRVPTSVDFLPETRPRSRK